MGVVAVEIVSEIVSTAIERPAGEGRVRRRVDGAPGAERGLGQAVPRVARRVDAVEGAHRADAPVHDAGPGRVLVEAVVLALVGDVRLRLEDRVRLQEPDLVRRRAVDRRPANEPGRRLERRRQRRPADVEAEARRSTGSSRPSGATRAHARVERVRRAGDPRQGDRERDGGRGRRLAGEQRAGRERPRGRELELVALRAGDGLPRERRRPRERVLRRVVGSEEEAVQLVRRGQRRRRAGARRGGRAGDEGAVRGGRLRGDGRGAWLSALSAVLRPVLEPPAPSPRRARTHPPRAGRRAGSTRGGRARPAPHGSASAGQPSALNGFVNRVIEERSESSAASSYVGATNPCVGVRSRSKPSSSSAASSRNDARTRSASATSASVTSRQARGSCAATSSP